jgi:hypothetical protein
LPSPLGASRERASPRHPVTQPRGHNVIERGFCDTTQWKGLTRSGLGLLDGNHTPRRLGRGWH